MDRKRLPRLRFGLPSAAMRNFKAHASGYHQNTRNRSRVPFCFSLMAPEDCSIVAGLSLLEGTRRIARKV